MSLKNLHLNQLRSVQDFLFINDDSLFNAIENLGDSPLLKNLLEQISLEPFFKRKNFDSIYDFGFLRVSLGVLTISLRSKKLLKQESYMD